MLRRLTLSSLSRTSTSSASAIVARQVTVTLSRSLASSLSSSVATCENANDRKGQHGWFTMAAAAAAAAGMASLDGSDDKNKTLCCGIAGVVGTPNHDAR